MPSEKHFLYHLIISQLYHDGFGPHATLLEEAALSTNRAIAPSDRLKQMLSACAHTVREVDDYFNKRAAVKEQPTRLNLMAGERPIRTLTPSPYHTLARRRLTAAKRHSVLAVNRGKYMRGNNSRNFMTSVYPKSVNVPIITSASSVNMNLAPNDQFVESISPTNVTVLQNILASTNTDSGIFSNTGEKDQSVEAVRVLQNIFQKRDILPNAPSIGNVCNIQSGMSQDLNSLIHASADPIGNISPVTSQINNPITKVSPHSQRSSPTIVEGATKGYSSHSPSLTHEDKTPVTSPTTSLQNRVSPVSEPGAPVPMESVMSAGDCTTSSQAGSPAHILASVQSLYASDNRQPSEADTPIHSIKEEPLDDHLPNKNSPIQYSPNSQDIINQLNSLSASGIGNIQNLANTLTNTLSDVNVLQDTGQLSSMSMNLSESLASTLNLSVTGVTGLESALASTPIAAMNQTFGGMTPSKLDFLSRLECNDKPSMLSMVSSQSRPSGSNTGTAAQGKRFQCPHCNKCYASYDCLSRHKRIHTGANKKTCPICFRLFFRADHFKTHLSTCNKKSTSTPGFSTVRRESAEGGRQDTDGRYRWAADFIDKFQNRPDQTRCIPRISGCPLSGSM